MGSRHDPDDLARAAQALRHDLGKGIRFSAPDALEVSTEALRERLRADVLETRRDGTTCRSAADVFEAWRRLEGRRFAAGPLEGGVSRIAQTMAEAAGLAARLDALDRAGLERLDALTRAVANECRALAEAAMGRER